MSLTLMPSARSIPQDENAQSMMRPAKGGLSARGGGGGLQAHGSVVKPVGLSSGPPQKGSGIQPEKRRALGDITNSGGGGLGSGGGGLKGKTILVASTQPLPAPVRSKQQQLKPQKLSAPIQLVASPLPSLSSSSSDDDMDWLQVDGPKGDGLQRQQLEEEDELASSASRAVIRAMPKGKAMFTCRPNSPIPWERTAEENAHNALLTDKIPSPTDLEGVGDFDLQF